MISDMFLYLIMLNLLKERAIPIMCHILQSDILSYISLRRL